MTVNVCATRKLFLLVCETLVDVPVLAVSLKGTFLESS